MFVQKAVKMSLPAFLLQIVINFNWSDMQIVEYMCAAMQ